ncbi:MAG: dephospho-CoA kinase [Prevotella sp.]|nr:dephospho-CoA kinase [Prevotella sp.]
MKIGITGGIGSGKSYVCRLLAERGITVYDCDSAAKRLMREDASLRTQLTSLIGPDTYLRLTDAEGHTTWQLNKKAVASFLLASQSNTQAINAIVHPAVIHDFETSGMQWMESAILYESGISHIVDRVVVVTAPEAVRIQRITQRDAISSEKAREWISHQWPQEKLRQLAHFEIINDGQQPLQPQIEQLLSELNG